MSLSKEDIKALVACDFASEDVIPLLEQNYCWLPNSKV